MNDLDMIEVEGDLETERALENDKRWFGHGKGLGKETMDQ